LNRLLEKLSERYDFHFLDLYPVFKNSDYASLFYTIDGHYTVDGHILVAEELCKFFQSQEILGAIGIESCDVDKAAVYESIEEFRHCSFNNTNKGLFLGGECFPRECNHAGQKVECITDAGQSGRQVCRDFKGWGTVLSECK
ncbi:MAG: SGNH/GDSL hydrolase family protein, partial [Candidatus Dadabacteria bacterium]|nr:SGNH/GDSL hydrolase family protein [Candidatus Dadabacteria bacterium]